MKTLNDLLTEINTFNNVGIEKVDFTSWGGAMVRLKASKFAAEGINRELGLSMQFVKHSVDSYVFVSMLPNVI